MDDRTIGFDSSARPRFCPRCGGGGEGAGPLCRECGETLRPRGYCAICESFWKREPGSDCPKHEVGLLDEAPRPEPFGKPGRAGHRW